MDNRYPVQQIVHPKGTVADVAQYADNPVAFRIHQFDLKHKSDGIVIEGWILYSDGAMREKNPMGALVEPPRNLHERGQLMIRYREEKLRRATDEFNAEKQQLTMSAKLNLKQQNRTPAPPCEAEAAVRQLEALKAVVVQAQADLANTRLQVAGMIEQSKTPHQRQQETMAHANMERNQQFLEAIKDISV